jgi:hypothetical protein
VCNNSCVASLFRGGGGVFGKYRNGKEYEIMYIKASAAVRIVSAIIKQGAMHPNCIQNSTIACVVDGKRFIGAHGPGQSLILEINHDVLPNETLQLQFRIDGDEWDFQKYKPKTHVRSKSFIQPNEKKFRNITKQEHVNMSLDFEGVDLVDSLNVMVLY